MVLNLSTVPSSCSSSVATTTDRDCLSCSSSNSWLVSPVVPLSTEFSVQNHWLQSSPYRFRGFSEPVVDSDSEDDDFSEGSSVSSEGASSFDAHSMYSYQSELDTLNERRREMLRLSISKIQTMNASNAFVSLRKSLLIFNTMKSLQRELDECDQDVHSSLMEGSEEAPCDDCIFEDGDGDEGLWDFERDVPSFSDRATENRSVYDGNADNYEFQGTITDAIRLTNMGLLGGTLDSEERNNKFNNSLWQFNNYSLIDDYLGSLDVWENADYNPLNNCNLSESEIMHMFGPSLDMANTQILTLA
uniref:SERTA domain-containing protein n=1 Tax=Syphacia muris TaxID=451379 RepID=A0A0N5A7M2_9BILA